MEALMSITFSSECKASFEPEPELGEPRRRARRKGRPRKEEAENDDLKSSIRSTSVRFEDFDDEVEDY
jgi:hypothetical protein